MQVALVLGMDGDRCIAEHGFGARCGYRDELAGFLAAVAEHGVANLPEMALLLLMNHFKIADSGLAARAPVDDVGPAIDEALMVKADEGFVHRDRQALIHREVLAAPVDGDAEALHLLQNGAAVMAFPRPHAFHEGFAAQLLARSAF